MIYYILNILAITFLVYWIYRKNQSSSLKGYFLPALGVKILAGIGVGLLYFYHYGYGDTVTYHQDAISLSNIAYDDITEYLKILFELSYSDAISLLTFSGQSRAFFLVKILSITHLLSGQSYWISGAYFSLFSFVGFWTLANTLMKHFPANKFGIIGAFLFFPSVVFWSSGIIKESIALGAMMLLIKLLIDWLLIRVIDWRKITVGLLLIWLVWHLKYYYLGIFLIVTVPLIITDLFSKKYTLKVNTYIIYTFFFVLQIGLVSLMHPNFNLSNVIEVIVDNHNLYVLKSQSDQFIHFIDLKATWLSIGYNFPLATWSGLFRMGIWEADQPLEYMLGLENLILLFFTLTAVFQRLKLKNNLYKLLLLTAVLYVILLAGFLALSAPNFGTLARYRVGYLPVMIFLIAYNNPVVYFLRSKFAIKVEDIG